MTMGFTGPVIEVKLGPSARAELWVRRYCEDHRGKLPPMGEIAQHTKASRRDILRAIQVLRLSSDSPLPAEDHYEVFCQHYRWHAANGVVKLRDLVLTTGLKERTCARYKVRFEAAGETLHPSTADLSASPNE